MVVTVMVAVMVVVVMVIMMTIMIMVTMTTVMTMMARRMDGGRVGAAVSVSVPKARARIELRQSRVLADETRTTERTANLLAPSEARPPAGYST